MGLISVSAIKVAFGLTILKPKSGNKEMAIIDTIFHLPSQIVGTKTTGLFHRFELFP